MMMFDPETVSLSVAVLEACRGRSIMLATAESCTGGLIAAALTEIAGSSDVVDRGFVTYSNDAKTVLLGVAPALLAEHGAVSEAVALAMAEGALATSRASIALAVTGIAGPGGGSAAKPVGRVHLAAAVEGRPTLHVRLDLGDIGRSPIRIATVKRALRLALEALDA